MQYLLMIYGTEGTRPAPGTAEFGAYINAYGEFTESIKSTNNHVGGNALQPISTATSVRVRNGETLMTDGPFAETKEQLGGYYLIEADNIDTAVEIASRIPTAKHGTIEVRPIMTFDN